MRKRRLEDIKIEREKRIHTLGGARGSEKGTMFLLKGSWRKLVLLLGKMKSKIPSSSLHCSD